MINKEYDEKMSAWLENHREEILQKWMELIRIPSVNAPALPNAPFGEACAQALKTAARNMQEIGLDVKLNEENGYATAEYGDGEKLLGLFGHSDVVPAGDGWLYTSPFEPIIRDGCLIGRGVSDNKSGVMATWCILSMFKALQIPLKNRLQVFVGSNEESGMKDIEAYTHNEHQPDLALVPDSRFPCGLGEKGILHMWARCDTALEAVLDIRGGSAFNIVLDRVEAVLAPNMALTAELQEKCQENSHCTLSFQDDGSVHITSNGIAKHAAYPADSLNATYVLADFLSVCRNLPPSDIKCLQTVAEHLRGYWGEGLGIAHEDVNFGPLTCSNGMVKVEDGHLMISLDIRYGITCDPYALEKNLYTKWEQAGWKITYMENSPGYSADPHSPFPAKMKAIAEEMTGLEMPFYRMPGGTYGRYLKTSFPIGVTAAHADQNSNTLALPIGHGGAHQRDEAVNIENFLLGVRILAQDILACDSIL